jgi:hypothetical protein
MSNDDTPKRRDEDSEGETRALLLAMARVMSGPPARKLVAPAAPDLAAVESPSPLIH